MSALTTAHSTKTVAAFDFDGTLTRRDTLMPFLAGGLGWPRFAAALLACAPSLAGYALRLVPNDVAKARLLRHTLAGRSIAEIERWAARLLAGLPAQLRDWTLERLDLHRSAGHCCVLVSASPDIYLASVARQLGFDALICTEMEVSGGVLTGEMRTPNCHGEQKVIRLRQWLDERYGAEATGIELHAYGDTSGDKPMLAMAGRGNAWYRGRRWNAG
ncbi:MAG: HAD-IB family hydrolase [Comamonadaceae bacterium]|nr:MAG: HAD-IB family hydrolase [Comamonadaceae bacterium]